MSEWPWVIAGLVGAGTLALLGGYLFSFLLFRWMAPPKPPAPEEDICGLCGRPGADKIPAAYHWPNEQIPDTDLVHAECEEGECGRAHSLLLDDERRRFLEGIR